MHSALGAVRATACGVVFVMLWACGTPNPAPEHTEPQPIENTTDSQWVVQQQPTGRVAIVFVHGIFGDAIDTWKHSNGSTLFKLVDTVPGIAGQAEMLAYGFESHLFKAGSFDINQAANRLHLRLDFHGVLNYSKIVFVGHSMGGLVILRELLSHRDLLPRVPVVVFYATPQEGAQITEIARHILPNTALAQMTPAQHNALLQTIDTDWKNIPAADRPQIRCAYENEKTHGVLIVPWASATRLCDHGVPPISADHLGIVKAPSAGHDTVAVLATALKQFVFNKALEPRLETPDFRAEGDRLVFDLTNAGVRHAARLVNAGGSSLRLTLAEVSDAGLHLWPDDTPKLLPANSTTNMHIALGLSARSQEYGFVLRTDELPERRVTVRVTDAAALRREQFRLMQSATGEINALLSDPVKGAQLRSAPAGDTEAPAAIIGAARAGVLKVNPELPESASWVMAAEALHAANWPGLAARALAAAEKVSPSAARAPGVRRLAAEAASLSGVSSVFSSAPTPTLAPADFARMPTGNLLVAASGPDAAQQLASRMQQAPSLRVFGLSLQGDAQEAAGNIAGAQQSLQEAAKIRSTPSISRRLRGMAVKPNPAIDASRLGRGAAITVTPERQRGRETTPAK
jgi:pimeloyl-ACP methyl ester carboxylesterase